MHKKTSLRCKWLLEMCSDTVSGEFVTPEVFGERLAIEEGAEPKRVPRLMKTLVDIVNDDPATTPAMRLEFHRLNGVKLESSGQMDQFRERRGKAVIPKQQITHFLLQWLFDLPSIDRPQSMSNPYAEPPASNFGGLQYEFDCNWIGSARSIARPEERAASLQEDSAIKAKLETKRRQLRSRTSFSLMTDSGTTTYSFATQLISAELPLKIKGMSQGHYLIQPSIFTNSLAIAAKIALTKHRRFIDLTVIGGRERPERRSLLGGSMALNWIKHMRMTSMLDLSVMGTTGITSLDGDSYGFFMDHSEEAILKRELLQIANFRIIICDSSKILSGSCGNLVSSISGDCVDLIVIDDGSSLKRKGCTHETSPSIVDEAINSFTISARISGVGVIIVKDVIHDDGLAS